jgi:hypothetical protein
MTYPVRAEYEKAIALIALKGIVFTTPPTDEKLAGLVRDILIEEKGYPEDTQVFINGDDPMAMVLVVDHGSWELV